MLTFFLVLAYFSIKTYAASAVLGIDLGTEYHKAVLVKPGIPLDIVLTKDSKRKEAAALAFKPVSTASDSSKNIFPERLYGGDALALAARFPGDVYANLKPLIGVTAAQSLTVSQYSQRYPGLQIAACKSGSVCLKSSTFAATEEGFSVEELLAMQLQNIRSNAELMAGTRVRDVVITVPAFFTADEKRAVNVAADLAGLKVLSLTTDGLAIGLNYATSRTFPTVNEGGKPEHHLFYDMGAGSTTATIVKFQGRVVKDVGKFNKTIQEILVAGSGWDRTLGGDVLNTLILEDMILQLADTKQMKTLKASINDVKAHTKTIARMWKEAERMRQVLSANTETQATFESLYHEDVNFKYKISRTSFEKLAGGLEERVRYPIVQALEAAKLEVSELDSIILHGGAVRTPFVQKALEIIAGKADRIRTNVNSDEAAAFGAAFRGATISPSFRVKEIWTNETATFPIKMTWNSRHKEKTQKLFIPGSYAGCEKQIPLKTMEEVSFTFAQDITDSTHSQKSVPVSRTTSTNLTASAQELKDKHGCVSQDITTFFDVRLSTVDTLPEVVRAYASCEALDTKKGVVDGVKGLFGFGSKKDGEDVLSQDDVTSEQGSSSASDTTVSSAISDQSSSTMAEKSKATGKPKSPVKKRFFVQVGIQTEPITTAKVFGSTLLLIQSRMKAFDNSDKDRRAKEEALNGLEAYTYRVRDLLSDEGFIAASVDQIRTDIKSKSEAASEWLYGDGMGATTAEFKAKLKQLKDLIDPISARKDENAKRPESVSSLQKALEQTRNIITGLKDQSEKAIKAAAKAAESVVPEPESTTSIIDPLDELDDEPTAPPPVAPSKAPSLLATIAKEDLEKVQYSFDAVEKWLADNIRAQNQLKASDEPILRLRDLETKANEIQMILIDAFSKQIGDSFPKSSKTSKSAKSTKSKSKSKTSSAKKSKTTDSADVKEEL